MIKNMDETKIRMVEYDLSGINVQTFNIPYSYDTSEWSFSEPFYYGPMPRFSGQLIFGDKITFKGRVMPEDFSRGKLN